MKQTLAIVLIGALSACGGNAPPLSRVPPTPAAASASQPSTPTSPPAGGPSFSLLLRPLHDPAPLVHIEVELDTPGSNLQTWRILRAPADRIAGATARDAAGDLGVRVSAEGAGVTLSLARTTSGLVHLAYDVRANLDAPDDPLGQLVLDDRFRGAGEGLIALPESIEDTTLPALVRIDGDALRASNAASSLGVGTTRRTKVRPRALRYASFVAGSLGAAMFEDPSNGRDEAAWLGYTAFDPRPAAAELSQIRSAFGELFQSVDQVPWTYLFVSQTRPIGSFSTTARAASVLVQVGPAEPWSAALALSVAQQLSRRWIGGELRLSTPEGHPAEGWWFSEGVARYLATRVLARLHLLPADDVREVLAGELAVLATTPYAKRGNADLAALAATEDVARAVLVARGALYAAHEAAVIRARTKGARSLDSVLVELMDQARHGDTHALPVATWLEALGKDDPDAAKSFDEMIVRGGPIALPDAALAPCFHAGTGEYVAFDPGFDVVATSESKDARVVGLRADGPAAKAGLRNGDVIQAMTEREGDADVPVKIVVSRSDSKVNVTYAPRGSRGRGQTWTRVRGVPDDRCGEIP